MSMEIVKKKKQFHYIQFQVGGGISSIRRVVFLPCCPSLYIPLPKHMGFFLLKKKGVIGNMLGNIVRTT